MTTSNQALVDQRRAQYMAADLERQPEAHQRYYEWLSDFIGLTDGLIPASNERVKASKDPHLNDIPLSSWDLLHPAVKSKAYTKGLAWSQSDTVCCLKAMAKRRAAK